MGLVGLALPMTLGLSATPTRKDGLTRVIHWYLGPLAYASKRTGQSGVTVRPVNFDHPRFRDPLPINRKGDLCYTSLMTLLVDMPDRTARVAAEARRLAEEGRRVLVLSHRRAHATAVAAALADVGAATYLGGDKAAPDAVVTCATYHLVSEGFDDPRLSALVLATPASDVVQACGRVMRGGNGADPVIVDVVDRVGVCFAQFAKRKRFYRETGFTVAGQNDVPDARPALAVDDVCMFVD